MKTLPLTVHKNLIIDALRRWPEDCAKFMPTFNRAEDAIAALEAHPGEWIVNGELVEGDPAENKSADGGEK